MYILMPLLFYYYLSKISIQYYTVLLPQCCYSSTRSEHLRQFTILWHWEKTILFENPHHLNTCEIVCVSVNAPAVWSLHWAQMSWKLLETFQFPAINSDFSCWITHIPVLVTSFITAVVSEGDFFVGGESSK